MKKNSTKVILAALLLFSIIGLIYTNPQIFKKKEQSTLEKEYPIVSDEQIEEENFYGSYRRLDSETFLKHQIGEIQDEVHYNDLDGNESWIKIESYEVVKEISDELIKNISKYEDNGIEGALKYYGEEDLNLSEKNYSFLKVNFRASNRGLEDMPYNEYNSTCYYLHSYDQRGIYGEGTLIDTGNLLFERLGALSDWSTAFTFRNKEENYFQIIYLVPDDILANDSLYIANSKLDDYLNEAWRYSTSSYVLDLNMKGE